MDEALEEESQREKFDRDKRVLNFKGMRASDVKSNPRVTLPKPRSDREELELGTRMTLLNQEVQEYIKRLETQPSSMTKSERRGLKKIKKRIKAKGVCVCETDKSGTLCMMPLSMYKELGKSTSGGTP